jgi:hypothetical protein
MKLSAVGFTSLSWRRDQTCEPHRLQQAGIASLIHVAYAARAEQHEDLIRSKHCARRERHDVVGVRNQKMCIIAALCAEDAADLRVIRAPDTSFR